tara:strand:+ start:3050 stop:3163 length:114 start_codon:yes stop_codon:yes gene_type:complete
MPGLIRFPVKVNPENVIDESNHDITTLQFFIFKSDGA